MVFGRQTFPVWPNVHNMLHPKMWQYAAFKGCGLFDRNLQMLDQQSCDVLCLYVVIGGLKLQTYIYDRSARFVSPL